MPKKIALIGIIIEDNKVFQDVNNILHEYSNIIIGRMGIPYRESKINIISLVVDGESDEINSLSGKLGMVDGISAKVMYLKQ
jgi:putative iron-only hydrogenase system regulator